MTTGGLRIVGVKDSVVVYTLDVVVTDDAHETDLVVDDEQSGVVPIGPLKLICGNQVDTKGSLVTAHRV
jgi:uncharacterized membrane protein